MAASTAQMPWCTFQEIHHERIDVVALAYIDELKFSLATLWACRLHAERTHGLVFRGCRVRRGILIDMEDKFALLLQGTFSLPRRTIHYQHGERALCIGAYDKFLLGRYCSIVIPYCKRLGP
jgi:hypothetical protein